jgi:PIN domain nuclease of toxin-antitoxin system
MRPVLDASAVLAYLHRESGWEDVRTVIGGACIGAVNWSEVAQKIRQRGLNVEVARALLADVGLRIVPFSASQAEIAAELWEATPHLGLSLADRACLALGIESEAPVLTADRTWTELGLRLEIRLVR